jgi:hypothetical protein
MDQITEKDKSRLIEEFKCEVDVCSVPELNPDEIENFKNKYFFSCYIEHDCPEYKLRLANRHEVMFNRWNWMMNNVEIYVNMLRLRNFSNEQIQNCLGMKRPLCFETSSIYDKFCQDLKNLKVTLENETDLKNIRFVQTGSSVIGFSNNPLKGLIDRPSKVTKNPDSDIDIVIVADKVKIVFGNLKKDNLKIHEYICVCNKEGLTDIRYGIDDLEKISKGLLEWVRNCNKYLKNMIQITFQDGDPIFPFWEIPLPINNK